MFNSQLFIGRNNKINIVEIKIKKQDLNVEKKKMEHTSRER